MPDPIALRASKVDSFMRRHEATLDIETMQQALSYGDAWRYYAYYVEGLLALAEAQWRSSETLRQIAEAELAKYQGTQ